MGSLYSGESRNSSPPIGMTRKEISQPRHANRMEHIVPGTKQHCLTP